MVDSLYRLLPEELRRLDELEADGRTLHPLHDLTAVVQEQIDLLAEDIDLLYEGWFVETCPPWVLPYLAALVGEQVPRSLGPEPDEPDRALARARLMVPRRLVANALRRRRRKGTRSVLEAIVHDVGAWPGHAVESYRRLVWNQHLDHQRPERGRFVDLRTDRVFAELDGPFDELAHLVDIRRVDALPPERPGRFNVPSVPVYAWRLQSFTVTQAPAAAIDRESGNVFTFSALGNDAPLFTRPAEGQPPVRLTRQMLDDDPERHYGDGRSLLVETGRTDGDGSTEFVPIPVERIKVASLRRLDSTDADLWPELRWPAPSPDGTRTEVIIDPEAGRLMFPAEEAAPQHVRVSYSYGFARAMGGGEYARPTEQPGPRAEVYRVGSRERFQTIAAAIAAWHGRPDPTRPGVIEIADSGVYTGPVMVSLKPDETLQLRAGAGARPLLRILDTEVDQRESLTIDGRGGCFTLDGVLLEGRGILILGGVERVEIRHSTLVPGWELDQQCRPQAAGKPSIVVRADRVCLTIRDSIVGPIHVEHDEVRNPAIPIRISDSIVDATRVRTFAVRRSSGGRAHAALDIRRSTIIGGIEAYAVELGEDSVFLGDLEVTRRQIGCLRFSAIDPAAAGPSRYRCQPDLVLGLGVPSAADVVWPQFETLRYGLPDYARLYPGTSPLVLRGASDAAEMGAYHDLYEPQRADNVRVRLAQATPASMDAGLIFAS